MKAGCKIPLKNSFKEINVDFMENNIRPQWSISIYWFSDESLSIDK